jgi:hypothetical protein
MALLYKPDRSNHCVSEEFTKKICKMGVNFTGKSGFLYGRKIMPNELANIMNLYENNVLFLIFNRYFTIDWGWMV